MKSFAIIPMAVFVIAPSIGLFRGQVVRADENVPSVDYDKQIAPILKNHCWKCHGPEKDKGGLRLHTREAALQGGYEGKVLVPGQADKSRLLLAVTQKNKDLVMPPAPGKKLKDEEIALLKLWINQGATWGKITSTTGTRSSNHWSFQPITAPRVPNNGEAHPIDAFIREKLKAKGLTPSPAAEKVTLLRRVTFDLLGLPPSYEEVQAFLRDRSETAWEKVVDRLLDSPHYGERWGRHWLDLARYADSDGYEKDTGRPFAWRYRDWVIQALNRDQPFDHFTFDQLAGDLHPKPTIDQLTATGFHRNTLTNKEGGVDQEEYRVAAVIDRVNTTTKTWLGLTVACAQCHDHKYDPVSQREYYQFFAFFNSDREIDLVAPLPQEQPQVPEKLKSERDKLVQAILDAKEKKLSTSILVARDRALAAFDQKHRIGSRIRTLQLEPKARSTHIMIRGDFLRPGIAVQPGTPGVLPQAKEPLKNRADLARWITSPENPLTARVVANWIWSKYFGRGIVNTLDDFGLRGELPTHPELLDYLAWQLQDPQGCGWSLKKFHKLIVTSKTYQQSSVIHKDLAEKDPLNTLYGRQSRLRLEAEILRDRALAVSGLLHREIGGPSIRPPQPKGISELTYANSARWVESAAPAKYKRGMYIWFQRTSPYPMLMTFDEPDSNVCSNKREQSNTPLQALTLLNDAVFVEAAWALARKLETKLLDKSPTRIVSIIFRETLAREPNSSEATILLQAFQQFEKQVTDYSLLGSWKPKMSQVQAVAVINLCRTLMNLDEFVIRD